MEYDWEDMFRPHILERGYDYYMTGAVEGLQRPAPDDTFYEAVVDGSRSYHVEIRYDRGSVMDMQCDCPYAMDGKNCKHMAAVLYEIEEKQEKSRRSTTQDTVPSEDIANVIQGISEDNLRAFLLELCSEDERIKNRVLLKYSASVSGTQLMNLQQELEEISERYSDRYGYISWDRTAEYEFEIVDFLDDNVTILVERNCVMEAFELLKETLSHVGEQDFDDSNGTSSEIASFIYACFTSVLKAGSPTEKETIFNWFEARIKANDMPEYAEDMISDFFDNEFHEKEFLLRKLKIFEPKGELPPETDWHARYRYKRNLVRVWRIMAELNYSEAQLQKYAKQYWQLPEIREEMVKRAVRLGNLTEAAEILQESKELDAGHAGLVQEHSRALIDLYQNMGDITAQKRELEFQIFSCGQSNLQYVLMLKNLSERDEWECIRERILTARSCAAIHLPLMESEGMMEHLLQGVMKSKSVFTLERYEDTLRKLFPEQIRDGYAEYVIGAAESASNRKEYNHLVRYLKKIKRYPNGTQIAAKIAKEWRTTYSRRRAMMDELNKGGF